MKRLISVTIIALLVMLSIDILGISFANSTIPNSITAQTAFAEEMALAPNEAITKAATLTKVTISPNKFTLAPGKTRQLNLTLTPSNASLLAKTEWESDNKEIATVDKNGKVTAIKEGIVRISFATWSKKDYSDSKYANTICYVSKKSPSAAALTSNDFQITIDDVKVNYSLSYNQVKKLFPGGKDDKNYDTKYMAYIVSDKNYTYSYDFLFKKTGDGNRKLLGAMCSYNGGGSTLKTPRGINLGSSTIIDVVNTYGFPSYCGDGYFLYYDVKIGKDSYTLMVFGERDGYSVPKKTIIMIGVAKNTSLEKN